MSIEMEGQIVVIFIGIGSLPKRIVGSSPATDLRDVRCVRLTKKIYFPGWMKRLRVDKVSRYHLFMLRIKGRRNRWIKKQ